MPKTRYVDLDGTLAFFDGWKGPTEIGAPVPVMVQKVKRWITEGDEVVIFTARINPDGHFTKPEECSAAKKAVEAWCVKFIGQHLKVTGEKGGDVIYDDRAERIQPNTGITPEETLLVTIRRMRNFKNHNDSGILDWVELLLKERIEQQNE
jgi:hypothetical protein